MRLIPIVFAFLALAAAPLDAQPRPSQHGGVMQTVNETTIGLEYDRPLARGRDLFGGIVAWDAVWTPGANRATWIDFSAPVTFEGRTLAAGRYGIWMVPHENDPWEVVIVSEWDTHHSFFPFESEVARVRVRPESGAYLETLGFYFPLVGPYETTLRFHWGTTMLPMRIEVGR